MRILLLFATVFLGTTIAFGANTLQKIPLTADSIDSEPSFRIIEQKSGSLTVEFELPFLYQEEVEIDGDHYQILSIPGGEFRGEVGQAALPVISRLLAVPDAVSIQAQIKNSDMVSLSSYRLIPQQPSSLGQPTTAEKSSSANDQKSQPVLVVDSTFYNRPGFSGGPTVAVGSPAYMRHLRVAPLLISPVRYDPVSGEVVVARRMTVEIHYSGGSSHDPVEKNAQFIPKSFHELYRQTVLNYQEATSETGPGSYLVIHPNNASVVANLEPLLEWRRQQGYNVLTASTSVTGTNAGAIKNYILDAYNSLEIPLEFVVLVGDANGPYAIATWYETLSMWTGEGDHYYTTLEGSDTISDIHIGRLSFQSLSNLAVIIDKIVTYETDPPLDSDPEWFTRACLTGDPIYSGMSCVFVNQWVKNQLLDLNYTKIDTIWSGPFASRMFNSVNAGTTIFGYRGFWDMSGWTTGHSNSLTNGYKLPFVVTLTCGTGMFADEINTRSESFLRAEGGGGVAAIGTSTIGTHTRYNNVMYVGIMEGALNSGDHRTGPALTRGKLEMFRQFWIAEPATVEIWSVWNNLMGDPATDLWSAHPESFNAIHPTHLAVGASSCVLTVKNAGDVPVQDACVALYKAGEILISGYTDNFGQVGLPLADHTTGPLAVTVTKHNFKPYRGQITIGPAIDSIDYTDMVFDDDSAGQSQGNGDGMVNPGETIELNLQLTNIGPNPAANIVATLSENDPHVNIVSDTQTFYALGSGDSSWSAGSYLFIVEQGAPGTHVIPFQLDITSDIGTWTVMIPVTVHAGACTAENFTWGGPGDTIDPDESGSLSFELRNDGNRDITSALATLSCSSPWISITDSMGTYGMIDMDQTGENFGDPFQIEVSPNCYQGHLVAFNIALEYAAGALDTTVLVVQVGEAAAGDPLGPDEYGYFAFDDTDAEIPFRPVYDWVEIDPDHGGNGVSLGLDDWGEYQDETAVVDLPFTFKYYGELFDTISVCSNGWICMGASYLKNYHNYSIPGACAPDYMIAAFWDDLRISTTSDVLTWYDQANHRYIVEWSRVYSRSGGGLQVFEIILFDPAFHQTATGDGLVLFQYHSVNNTDSLNGYATVGIQNGDNTDGILYTYWNYYSANAAPLTAGRAILFTPIIPGQQSYAEGMVTNATAGGSPVDGAIINFTTWWSLASNSAGTYAGAVPAGTHTVTISHESFAPDTIPNVTYTTGETTVLDFQLHDSLGPYITNTTQHVSVSDTLGPYIIETTLTDLSPIAEVSFYYTTSISGGAIELPILEIDPATGLHRAEIPGQPLGTTIQYWLTASDIGGNLSSDPVGAPWQTYIFGIVDIVTIFADDMENDLGWTVGDPYDNATSGIWEWCDPNGVWEEDILVQPEDDATPDPGIMCYITGNDPPGSAQGTDDVDVGRTTLFTPWFDLSLSSSVTVSYKRWFTHDTGFAIEDEHWIVQITNDGVNWVDIENSIVSERSWLPQSFLVDNFIDLTSTVRFRFIADDFQYDSIVEAGVDDFLLTAFNRPSDSEPPSVAVITPNGGENLTGGGGNIFPIEWNASDDTGIVLTQILLSTDSGITWPDTLANGALTSPWEWSVPVINQSACRIRVVCWDALQNSTSDSSDADFTISPAVGVDTPPITQVTLLPNRPNPFNPKTEIRFALPRAQDVSLMIYDLEGRLVHRLVHGHQEAGDHIVFWQGEDSQGSRVASGVYFYRLVTSDKIITHKMVLLK